MSEQKALAPVLDAATMENVLVGGDLEKLSPAQRVSYYKAVCDSLGLNPLTKPFAYIRLNGKLTLYALRDTTDQLRAMRKVSITSLDKHRDGDLYIVTAAATGGDGRSDVSTGVVSLKGLSGDALANAIMKAETKAKRRVTLSICGLGWLDETEIETIRDAEPVRLTDEAGMMDAPSPEPAKAMSETSGTPTSPPANGTHSKSEIVTEFWAAVKHAGLTREDGQRALAECQGSFEEALGRLQKGSQ